MTTEAAERLPGGFSILSRGTAPAELAGHRDVLRIQ
jgi:hypothetical protein